MSAETSEEEADRVLAAVDSGLVALSSDKGGGVPYYRLHRVVAKAIRRKKFIFVSENAAAVAAAAGTAAGRTCFALEAHFSSKQ